MTMKLAASCIVAGALMLPIAGYAAESDSAKTMISDSAITTKIKADLAQEKVSSLVKISVETDSKGMVTLGGTAGSKDAVDRATTIARAVKGVTSVENHIQIAADK
jgi:hyperosmotically inducible periplasmic protein